MDAASFHEDNGASVIAQRERQQKYYQSLFRMRTRQFWYIRILLLLLSSILCIWLAALTSVTMIGVFAGIAALLALLLAAKYEPCALVLLTLCTTDFVPTVFSAKTLLIRPVVLLLPVLLLALVARQAFHRRRYNWPALPVIWPMAGLVLLAVVSNAFIQVTWTPGVPRQENANSLLYSEALGILLYALPPVLLALFVALLTYQERWVDRIVHMWRGLALLAAAFVLVDFARFHTSFYAFRFEEPTIGWISLQALAMPLALGCIISYTCLLHAGRWRARLLCIGELTLCTIALLVTLQNSWWIEVIVGVLMVTLLHSRRLLIALIAAGLLLFALLQGQFVTLMSIKAGDANRLIVWQDILRIWKLHPLLGVGPGNVWTYDQHFTHLPLLLRDFNATGLGVAHNGYLQVLAELGPLGVVLLLALLFTLGLACWRLYRRSLHPEALHDRTLALIALGLLCGSALADFTSGAFFYPNSQIGGFNALPSLLNNWVIFALVLYKDKLWRQKTQQMTNAATLAYPLERGQAYPQKISAGHDDVYKAAYQALPTSQWIPGTTGFVGNSIHIVPEQVREMDGQGDASRQKEHASRAGPTLQSEITQAAGNAALVGVGNIVGSVLKYGSNFLLQIGFGAAIYGLYSVALSLILLVAAICDLGLDITTTRYVAMYRDKGKGRMLRGLTIFCSSVSGIAGLLGALLVLYLAPLLAALKQEPQLALALQLMAPIVPLLCMQTVWLSALQGFRAFGKRVLAERLLMPAMLILLIAAAIIYMHNLVGIVLATLISFTLGTLASLYYLVRVLARSARHEIVRYKMREWAASAALSFFTALIEEVLESLDLLLLALLAVADVQIGQYSAAMKISDFIAMPLFSFNTIFAPAIAELYSKGEQHKLAVLFQVVTRWTILCSLPLFCLATLFSSSLLGLAGTGFAAAWPLLIIAAAGTMINAATGSVGYVLLMTGHQRLSLLNSLLAVLLNIAGAFLLVPRYGALGMVITTTAVLALINIVRLIQVRLLLHLFPYNLAIRKPLLAGLVSSMMISGVFLLSPNLSLWLHLLCMPAFILLYVGLLLVLGGEPEDVALLNTVRGKFRAITRS